MTGPGRPIPRMRRTTNLIRPSSCRRRRGWIEARCRGRGRAPSARGAPGPGDRPGRDRVLPTCDVRSRRDGAGAPARGIASLAARGRAGGRWRRDGTADRDSGDADGDRGGDRHGRLAVPGADSWPMVEEEGLRGSDAVGRDDRAGAGAGAAHGGSVRAHPAEEAGMPSRATWRYRRGRRSYRRAVEIGARKDMGFRFDDESRDSLDAGRPASASFSMVRAREAGAARGAAPRVGRGPAGRGPRNSLGRWPTDRSATRTPPACSWKTTSSGGAGARKASLSDYQERFPEQTQAFDGCWRRRRSAARWAGRARARASPSACPTWATRCSASACAGRWARARSPASSWREQADLAGRPVVLKVTRHRRERAADPRPAPARQHRARSTRCTRIGRGPASRLHALPGRGEPLGGPGPALGRLAASGRRRAVRPGPGGGRGPAAGLAPEGGDDPGGRAATLRARRASRTASPTGRGLTGVARRGGPPLAATRPELRARGGLDRGPARRGAAPRPPAGHPPPRHQAVEHPHQRRGPAAAAGFQPRPGRDEDAGRTPRSAGPSPTWPPSTSAPGRPHARADPPGGPAVGHLLAGHGPGRDAHGPPPVRAERELLGAPLADRGHGRRAEQGASPRSVGIGRTSPGAWRASSASAWPPTRRGGTSRPTTWPTTCAGSWKTARSKYAPELSRVERARKFARRHPRLASAGIGRRGGRAASCWRSARRLAAARSQLGRRPGRATWSRDHDAGVQKALCLVNTRLDLQDHLREGIAACERTLALFGRPEGRTGTSTRPGSGWRPEDRRRLAEDRRELLLLLADARVRLAAGIGGLRRAGPATARRGRVDPRPARLPRALARPRRATGSVAARPSGPPGGPPARRADPGRRPPGTTT